MFGPNSNCFYILITWGPFFWTYGLPQVIYFYIFFGEVIALLVNNCLNALRKNNYAMRLIMMRDFSQYYYMPPILLLKYIYLVSAWQLYCQLAKHIQSSNSSHLWSLLTKRNVDYNVLWVCLRWKWIILTIILFITLFSLKRI